MKPVLKGLSVTTFFAVWALGSQVQAQDKLRLTIAHGLTQNHPHHYWFTEVIGPKLQKDSNGRIQVNVQGNATLCSEDKCVEQARLGQIDIGAVGLANIGSFGTTFDILNLPFILQEAASAEKLMHGWLGKELAARAEKEMGLHIMAFTPSYGFRDIVNTKREVRVPADLKGLKIRTTKSPIENTLFKSWGATAIPFDWAQVYEGLQTGVIDGMYVPNAFLGAQRFYEVVKYTTHMTASFPMNTYFLEKKRYDRLPDWAKRILANIGDDIRARSFKVDTEWAAKHTGMFEGRVKSYTPTPREMEQWHEGAVAAWVAAKGTFDPNAARRALKEQGQDAFIKKLEAAKAL